MSKFDIYVDGAFSSRLHAMGVGWVVLTPDGEILKEEFKRVTFSVTDGMAAEALAILEGLRTPPEDLTSIYIRTHFALLIWCIVFPKKVQVELHISL
jgi:ribonuclease HI